MSHFSASLADADLFRLRTIHRAPINAHPATTRGRTGTSRNRRRRIDALFAGALDLPATQRSTFLTAHTTGDPELRGAVEKLLAAVAEHDGELATGGALMGALGEDLLRRHDEVRAIPEGSRIGRFRILDELGRGGMAVVYRAERADGEFEQQVAIKLLKRGTDTEEILRRFVQERQILASLEHPAIARLLDGGATEDGQPFLAMELVEGWSRSWASIALIYCNRCSTTSKSCSTWVTRKAPAEQSRAPAPPPPSRRHPTPTEVSTWPDWKPVSLPGRNLRPYDAYFISRFDITRSDHPHGPGDEPECAPGPLPSTPPLNPRISCP